MNCVCGCPPHDGECACGCSIFELDVGKDWSPTETGSVYPCGASGYPSSSVPYEGRYGKRYAPPSNWAVRIAQGIAANIAIQR